jgi:hypothetical protein
MALSSSGQISMGDINVELGRTRTTGNTKLAGNNFNTTLSVADHTRIVNGTTGQEMDYDFAGSVEGNSDKFGVVLVINGSLSKKVLRVNDDNEMTSVTNC